MKRLHVHVAVEDLARSIRFYATLFAAEPSVTKPDYAKWMLDDPRMNFAISAGARGAGRDLLLRPQRQAVDHRPAGRRLGDLPDPRRGAGVRPPRRGRASGARRGARGDARVLLRTGGQRGGRLLHRVRSFRLSVATDHNGPGPGNLPAPSSGLSSAAGRWRTWRRQGKALSEAFPDAHSQARSVSTCLP